MTAARFSSSDPVADRRADYAEQFAARGDFQAAADVLSSALELVPAWTAGWFRLGEFHEKAGQGEAALRAWDQALELDPADPFGASLKRDLARAMPVAESMPPAFVELLFDQYASRFDAALTRGLEYRGPDILLARLQANGFERAAHALDLGCGTGLMGEVLRPFSGRLAGVDLSAGMLAEAEAKGVYDALAKADIARMDMVPAQYDLIVAADVFAYVGALEAVIAWCRAALLPGGYLAFTVEAAEEDIVLKESRRFAHGAPYLENLLTQAGFAAIDLAPCVVRKDRGEDIHSFCVVAALPAICHDREGDGEARIPA
ncbi:MAG: methyltransferase domain-containing protein [Caulobacterales bacterium]|uniref:class I SAM-dependent DNA methyltransferase n=1 Tax=Glycocaulis sp. TaxID=1969725 RepID=UPI003FA1251E